MHTAFCCADLWPDTCSYHVRCLLQEQLRKLEGRQARAGVAAATEVETALTTVSLKQVSVEV
jgi:hypothetical protein